MNNDIEIITPDWIEEMLQFCMRSDVGIVGSRLFYPDDTIQHAGIIIGYGNIAGHAFLSEGKNVPGYMGRIWAQQDISAVTAACMMVKKSVFLQAAGLDENYKVDVYKRQEYDCSINIRKSLIIETNIYP